MPLSKEQHKALDELLIDSGDKDEPILYIDGLARPIEPWYEIIKKVVPKLILEPFKTYEIYNEIYHDSWPRLVECLEKNAQGLSLPEDITSPVEVISAPIRHRLWLQTCFDTLSGLGQEEELTLTNKEQKSFRIEWFIDMLKKHKDSVEFLNLSLKKLFELVKLPPVDEKILNDSMMKELKIKSISEKIKNVL